MQILRFTFCVVLFQVVAVVPLYAQIPPASAHVYLYFPQLADGGPQTQQWQTSFDFSNPYTSTVLVALFLFDDDGLAMQMDFGSGAVSDVSFSIPGNGTTTLRSRSTSPTINTGWAIAVSTLPVQGVATYRFVQNGTPRYDISVPATLPTIQYFSAANAFLGVAVANTSFDESVSVLITANGNSGSTATGSLLIPAFGHKAKSLREIIPDLESDFAGTISITSNGKEFVALTLKSDDGALYSSLPSGAVASPISQISRIWNVFARVHNAARDFDSSLETVDLSIGTAQEVNAFGGAGGIQINLALAELLADSESELAFIIGHELGHVYQFRTGNRTFNLLNAEKDADAWGMLLSLVSGYDPYAGAGALAKLAMIHGDAGLESQFIAEILDASGHGSFNNRLDSIYNTIQFVCDLPGMPAFCSLYHDRFHPHVPGVLLTTEP